MRIPVSKLLPVSLLLLLVNSLSLAQNATGSIRGSVIDEQGAALPNATVIVTNVDLDGDGVSTTLLPGLEINRFGRGTSADDIRRLVDAYNQTYAGKRDTFNRTIGAITLPPNFSNGDSFFSQDLRVTRIIRIGENVKLTLIGEGFNIFNIANNIGYSSTLGTATGNYGQPTDRVNQVFGSGGPRAFQFAARISL